MSSIRRFSNRSFWALLVSLALHSQVSGQNVGINGTGASPDASAMLDISSDSKGLLIPRMTVTERDAIPAPAVGLLVYVTSNNTFYYFNGTIWVDLIAMEDPDWSGAGSGSMYPSSLGDNIGIGITTPLHRLDIFDALDASARITSPKNASIILQSDVDNIPFGPNPDRPEIIFLRRGGSESGFARIAGLGTSTTGDIGGSMVMGMESSNNVQIATNDSVRVTVNEIGMVGIGSTNPNKNLIVYDDSSAEIEVRSEGDATVTITADIDNLNEMDNPELLLLQDGGSVFGHIKLEGDAGSTSTGTLANALLIGSEDDTPDLQFTADDDVKMTIRKSGRVGIGFNTPQDNVHIHDTSNDNVRLRMTHTGTGTSIDDGLVLGSTSTYAYLSNDEGLPIRFNTPRLTTRMTILASGNVGIGTVTPGWLLEVNGSAAKPGGAFWANSSDIRLKRDIHKYEDGLSSLLRLNPVKFKYNHILKTDTTIEYVGLIAQELDEISPYMVGRSEVNGTEYYTIDSSPILYMLVNSVKELNYLIAEKDETIHSISKEMEEQRIRIEQLEILLQRVYEAAANQGNQ